MKRARTSPGLILRQRVCVDNVTCALEACRTEEEKRLTSAFLCNILHPDNTVVVLYTLKYSDLDVGRFVSSADRPSVNVLPRKVREFLVHPYYYDVDMCKSGPSIVFNYAKSQQIPTPYLQDYLERDVFPPGCQNKKDVLCALNGAQNSLELRNEGSLVAKALLKCEKNEDVIAIKEYIARSDESVDLDDLSSSMLTNQQQADEQETERYLFRFLALWTQTQERRIVCKLIDEAQRSGYQVGAYLFDGIYIENTNDRLPPPPIDKWSEAIGGYRLQLKSEPTEIGQNKKLMENEDIFSQDYLFPQSRLLPYLEMKRRFEQRVFRVRADTTIMVLCDDQSTTFMSHADLIKAFSNIVCSDLSSSFVRQWLSDPNSKTYRALVFAPPPKQADFLDKNVWRGFELESCAREQLRANHHAPPEIETSSNTYVNFFLTYVFGLFETKEESMYFLRFVAHMLRFPGKKPKVALMLFGLQGTGKNMLLALVEQLVGSRNCLNANQPRYNLWGKFNSCLANKILVIINELGRKDTLECEDLIKDMITCDKMIINEKCKPQYSFDSFERYIVTTNNATPLHLTNDDRRWVVFEMTTKFKGNSTVFEELARITENREALVAIFAYFLSLDNVKETDFMSSHDRPITARYRAMIQDSMSPFARWWKMFVNSHKGKGEVCVLMSDMYSDFVAFLQMEEEDFGGAKNTMMSMVEFSRQVSAVLPAKTPTFRQKDKRGRKIDFDALASLS